MSHKKIVITLADVMKKKKVSLKELQSHVGITMANLSLLKQNKVSSIRFSTLEKICEYLNCQPGDILRYKEVESSTKDLI